MSLKPPKKSDLGKSWMKKKPDKKVLIHPEYHLIVSEGTDTEPAYFGAIKEIINSKYKGRIQLEVKGEGDNTLNLFQKAYQKAQNDAIEYKHVWIVYDTDDFPAEHIDKVVELCQKQSKNGETKYHAIWSNQCIEVWFLLHFSYMQSDLHRAEYWPKLTEQLERIGAGSYEKNRKDMYELLRPYLEIAIAHAKRLETVNTGRPPSKSAPGTKIYELIQELKVYL